MWGFWRIFPILGIVLFIGLIVLLFKAVGGGSFSGSRKEIEEMRKEMRELKEEIDKLKKQRRS